jgi:hypothetical protein
MPNPQKPSGYLVEVLASSLFFQDRVIGGKPDDPTDHGALWRKDPDLRGEYRQHARALLVQLEEKGVKVMTARPTAVERAAKELTIVPASVAYVIEDDGK